MVTTTPNKNAAKRTGPGSSLSSAPAASLKQRSKPAPKQTPSQQGNAQPDTSATTAFSEGNKNLKKTAAKPAPAPLATSASGNAATSSAGPTNTGPTANTGRPTPPTPTAVLPQQVTVSNANPLSTGGQQTVVNAGLQPATNAFRAAAGSLAGGFTSSFIAYGIVGNGVEALATAGFKRAGVPDKAIPFLATTVGGATAGVSLRVSGMIAKEVGAFVGRNQFQEPSPAQAQANERKIANYIPPLNKVMPDVAGFAAAFAMFNGIDAESQQILSGSNPIATLAFKAARSGTGGALAGLFRDGVQAIRTLPQGSVVTANRMPPNNEEAWKNVRSEIKSVFSKPHFALPKDSPTRGTAANAVATAAGFIAFTAVTSAVTSALESKLKASKITGGSSPAPSLGLTAAPLSTAPSQVPSPTPSTQPSARPSAVPTGVPTGVPTTKPVAETDVPTIDAVAEPDGRMLQTADAFAAHGGYNAAAIVVGVSAFVIVEHIVGQMLNAESDRAQNLRREALGLASTYEEERQSLPTSAAAPVDAGVSTAGAAAVAPGLQAQSSASSDGSGDSSAPSTQPAAATNRVEL